MRKEVSTGNIKYPYVFCVISTSVQSTKSNKQLNYSIYLYVISDLWPKSRYTVDNLFNICICIFTFEPLCISNSDWEKKFDWALNKVAFS
jgi:hypothetical protein